MHLLVRRMAPETSKLSLWPAVWIISDHASNGIRALQCAPLHLQSAVCAGIGEAVA